LSSAVTPTARGRGRPPASWVVYGLAAVGALLLGLIGSARTDDGIVALAGTLAIPYAFVLFVLVLLGIALFHQRTLLIALLGLLVITLYTVVFTRGFDLGHHFLEEGEHTLLNLGGLLLGFALLAKFFEHSGVPAHLPRLLPRNPLWGGFALLGVVWLMSAFLDNIAAAMIGGVIARSAYSGKVSVAYVVGIVAASNSGGAWSVLGDTTTTMMWIEGVSAWQVMPAILPSFVALLSFGLVASMLQNRVQPIAHRVIGGHQPIDWVQLGIVGLILAAAITTNVVWEKPFVGVWAAILVGALVRRPAWGELPGAAKGAVFLLALVWCASLMPVKALPEASWQTTFGLGFVSAVFDNIPLTKLALKQDGYDWAMLAYAVGFGGSMVWFGSSSGVAISKDFPEARSVARYVKEGWPVIVAYVLGFFAMLLVLGWHPAALRS